MYYLTIYYKDDFFGFVNSRDLDDIKISQCLSDAPKYDIAEAEFVKDYICTEFKYNRPIGEELQEICEDIFEEFNTEDFNFKIENLHDERKNKILSILEE
jgi:hypothetical protein